MILSILLFLASAANALVTDNLSTMREDCRTLVKDSGTTRRRFSDATLNGFISEGQREVMMALLPIRKSTEFDLQAGVTYYTLPDDFLQVRRVTRDYLVLPEMSVAMLDKRSEWQRVGGLPTAYFVSFASRTKVGFYPWPDSSSSTGTIRLEYNAMAQDLTTDLSEPFNGIVELQQYDHLLAHYCAYRASMIYGQQDLAAVYLQNFKEDVKRMGETALGMPNYNPGVTPGTAPK
jgi:hypothetical protein